MLDAAEGGALLRRRSRVIRVDLDDPAEAERLVRLLRQVEARVELLPAALRGPLADAVALVQAAQSGSSSDKAVRLAKYCWKFSSPVSAVPHGVVPPAQLLIVPNTCVPVGSSLVLQQVVPAAGPVTSIGVVPVIRRLYCESWTSAHSPASLRCTSTMLRPWAASSTSTVS